MSRNDFSQLQFPKNFIFGTATAAYEIEGGYRDDGKGLCIWDTFSHKKGKIMEGHTGEIACNTYQDFQTDIDLMADLNMDAYRFSMAWSRVIPEGKGKINKKGMDYYSKLVDSLLEKGIRPFITLYHWDMPQALYQKNKGFVSKETASYFAEYAAEAVQVLGDRVKDWITLNEPWEHAMMGHMLGEHAPGLRSPWAYTRVAHHQLLGHGLALQSMRSIRSDLNLGITLSQFPVYPQNFDAGKKDLESVETGDLFLNRFFLDALYKGQYPEKLMKKLKPVMPKVRDEDMKNISQPLDFLGVNYYNRVFTSHKWFVPRLKAWVDSVPSDKRYHHPELGAYAYPAGMKELAKRYREEYGNPVVYITENGTGANCRPDIDKFSIQDDYRINYVYHYLTSLREAIEEGSDIRGYFYWTLMDNFTWHHGYTHPMGLIHVDFENQKRIVRDSGFWFKSLIENQKLR